MPLIIYGIFVLTYYDQFSKNTIWQINLIFLETLLAKFSSYKGVQNQKLEVGQRISGDALICEMKLK